MNDPLAYFLTWTTYGSWLPGDRRGWVDRRRRHGEIVDQPAPFLEAHARGLLKEDAAVLDEARRMAVDSAMSAACHEFGWLIHALAVRSNHVHIVVTAAGVPPGTVMGRLKVRGTRALNGLDTAHRRNKWWTEDGSKRILYLETAVQAAVEYVRNQ